MKFVFQLPGQKSAKVSNQTIIKSKSVRKEQENDFFSFLLERNSGDMSLFSRTKTFIEIWFLVSNFGISATDIGKSTFPQSSLFNLSWSNTVFCLLWLDEGFKAARNEYASQCYPLFSLFKRKLLFLKMLELESSCFLWLACRDWCWHLGDQETW